MTAFTTHPNLASGGTMLEKASSIFEYTHIAATSLVSAFDDAKAKRGNKRGVLTDQEQDILRAALVMCCAGMDAALKQAIRDCLPRLIAKSDDVRDAFERFIQKRISGDGGQSEALGGAKFLASLLADPEPRVKLIEAYIRQLTGDSLQSADEVLRTLAALGIDRKSVGLDVTRLKDIFMIRNKIIHELDIDLAAKIRKRKVRSQADLLANSDHVLKTTKAILEQINQAVA